ncbi:hypothetical protein GEMRC1_007726 [Eukaryota sp. GEM-RC1]
MPKRSSTTLPSRETISATGEHHEEMATGFVPLSDDALSNRRIRTLKKPPQSKPTPPHVSVPKELPAADMSLTIDGVTFTPPLGKPSKMFDVNNTFYGEFVYLAKKVLEEENNQKKPTPKPTPEPTSEPLPDTQDNMEKEEPTITVSEKKSEQPLASLFSFGVPKESSSNPFDGLRSSQMEAEDDSDSESDKEAEVVSEKKPSNPFASSFPSFPNPFAESSSSVSNPFSATTFAFPASGNAGTNPFLTSSSNAAEQDEDDDKMEEAPEPEYKGPVVELEEKSEVTGEEDEENIMEAASALFVLKKEKDAGEDKDTEKQKDTGKLSWVSRGLGH